MLVPTLPHALVRFAAFLPSVYASWPPAIHSLGLANLGLAHWVYFGGLQPGEGQLHFQTEKLLPQCNSLADLVQLAASKGCIAFATDGTAWKGQVPHMSWEQGVQPVWRRRQAWEQGVYVRADLVGSLGLPVRVGNFGLAERLDPAKRGERHLTCGFLLSTAPPAGYGGRCLSATVDSCLSTEWFIWNSPNQHACRVLDGQQCINGCRVHASCTCCPGHPPPLLSIPARAAAALSKLYARLNALALDASDMNAVSMCVAVCSSKSCPLVHGGRGWEESHCLSPGQ